MSSKNAGSSDGVGCGCCLAFFVGIPLLLKLIIGLPFWVGVGALLAVAWTAVKVVAANGVAVGVFFGVLTIAKKAKKAQHGTALSYVGQFLPVTAIEAVADLFIDSERTLRRIIRQKMQWYVPVLASLMVIAASDALVTACKLPPMKMSAALSLYHTTITIAEQDERAAVDFFNSVLARLEERSDEEQTSSWLARISYQALSMEFADDRISVEIMKAGLLPGTSFLGIYLESAHGLRTAGDLADAVAKESPEHQLVFEHEVDEWEGSSLVDRLLEHTVLTVFAAVFALAFLALPRSLRFSYRAILGIAFSLIAVFFVAGNIAYVATSFVTNLAVAQLVSFVVQLAVLEIWCIGFIPNALALSRWRVFLLGNGAWILLEIASAFLMNWFTDGALF